MFRFQIIIEYDGTNFVGWQIQTKGQSVQKLIQIKISKLIKEKINLIGSGRTDSGVHAIWQSAHFDCKRKIENLNKFLLSINYSNVISNVCIINPILSNSSGEAIEVIVGECIQFGELNNEIGILNCTHIYHKKCIKLWLLQKPICPLCQYDIFK